MLRVWKTDVLDGKVTDGLVVMQRGFIAGRSVSRFVKLFFQLGKNSISRPNRCVESYKKEQKRSFFIIT